MRFSKFFGQAIIALSITALSVGAFAAKEGFKSPTANPGYGGSVRSLISITGNPNLLYSASEHGGVIKSVDAGVTWTPINNGLSDLSVRGITPNPSDPSNTLYAVTTGGKGFHKTTDGGATWVPLPLSGNMSGLTCRSIRQINVVNVTGVNLGHIFVSTSCPRYSGVFKSEDGGATWVKQQVGLPDDVSVNNVNTFGTNGASTIGARVSSSSGFHFNTTIGVGTGGAWIDATGGLTGPQGTNVFNVVSGSPTTTWLASVVGQGVFISSAGTSVWTQKLGSGGAPKATASITNFGTSIYAGVDGEGVYKSTDNGQTWALDPAPPANTGIIVGDANSPSGAVRWAFTSSGLYKSVNTGGAFVKNTGAGQPGGYVTNVVSDPTNANILYAAGDTVYKSTDGGLNWAAANTGLLHNMFTFGQVSVISNGAQIFATTGNGGVYKSTDGAATWTQLTTPFTGSSLRIRLSYDQTGSKIYASVGRFGIGSANGGAGSSYYKSSHDAKFGLYYTINGGTSWTQVVSLGNVGSVNLLSVSPTSSNDLLVATGSGIYKSIDGGATWFNTGPAVAYIAGGGVSGGTLVTGLGVGGVRHDPLNGQNVIATVYDVDHANMATVASGFYRSKDGGYSWTNMASSEKGSSGSGFALANGKSYVYLLTAGFYGDDTQFDSVYKCASAALFGQVDSASQAGCSPLSVGGTNDNHPVRSNSIVTFQGGLIGLATAGLGYEKLYRKNIGPDFNNDGIADVFLRNATLGQNFVWQLREGANAAPAVDQTASGFSNSLPAAWDFAGAGDFNGDGNTDILWRNNSTGENGIHFMDGTTTLPQSNYTRTVPTAWIAAGVGDFNGDGVDDIIWRNTATGENYMYLMNGIAIIGEGYIRTVPLNWVIAGVGDYDGDGKADILLRNTSTGENYIYFMSGTAIVGEGYTRSVPTAWTVAGVGDFDGNGKSDILLRNTTTGENYVYYMSGTSVVSEGYLPTVSDLNWQIKRVADYSGKDGKAEILWSNSTLSVGQNNVWRLNGLIPSSSCSTLGCPVGDALPSAPANWVIISK